MLVIVYIRTFSIQISPAVAEHDSSREKTNDKMTPEILHFLFGWM